MKKDLELWKFIAGRLESDRRVVLLVVAESRGSSPGRPGFKMAVAGDELHGSIGGGVMEVALVERARETTKKSQIPNPKSQIVNQVHRKNAPDASGMICSGEQTVIFFELQTEHLEMIREIIRALEDQRSCRLLITDLRLQIADLDGADDFDFRFEQKSENEFVFEERLGYRNRLFIVGGGHCALALSELMAKMDFYIALFDDRPELNTLDKNKFAHEQNIISSYAEIGDHIPSGRNHYVVVMTLGYKFDEIVVRRLFHKDFKYFGVLGSRAKMAVLWRDLRNEGFDEDRLAKIHTPIGLPINSRTPEEIAVSIAAEIIAVKNTKG